MNKTNLILLKNQEGQLLFSGCNNLGGDKMVEDSHYNTAGFGSNNTDYDYYKFKLDKPGQVTLFMKNNIEYTWSFTLENADKKIL